MDILYRKIDTDGSISDIEYIDTYSDVESFNYCPYCNSFSYHTWESTFGEYSSKCYCCGYNNTKTFSKEDVDLEYETFILIKEEQNICRINSTWYIAQIIPPTKKDNKANIMKIETSKYNQSIFNEDSYKALEEIDVYNNFSLILQHPNEHKVEVIDGLYKGLIIDMKYICWQYKNHFEEYNPSEYELNECKELLETAQMDTIDDYDTTDIDDMDIPF